MSRADLHTHSTASDGRLSPAQLVELASQQGVSLMALTDHDTTAGLDEALQAGRRHGVRVVAGVEISADYEPGTMHILGLGIRPEDPGLKGKLAFLQRARRERNPRMAARLRELGLDVEMAEVEGLAKGGLVGRPHFAQLLVDKGLAGNFEEAFGKWLGKGAAAYIPKTRLSPRDAIAVIQAAGGLAVLAHPIQLRLEGNELEALLGRLKAEGLDGIEAWHSDHSAQDVESYTALAAKLGLKLSGGSDFHGIPSRKVELGRPEVSLQAALELLKGRI